MVRGGGVGNSRLELPFMDPTRLVYQLQLVVNDIYQLFPLLLQSFFVVAAHIKKEQF